jgi:hypothetical protein
MLRRDRLSTIATSCPRAEDAAPSASREPVAAQDDHPHDAPSAAQLTTV